MGIGTKIRLTYCFLILQIGITDSYTEWIKFSGGEMTNLCLGCMQYSTSGRL